MTEAVTEEVRRDRRRPAGASASWNTQALPSWATFSSTRHARQEVVDPFVDGRCGSR